VAARLSPCAVIESITLRIPKPGQGLVVATAGDDWGCFVVDVAERKANTN
jgi:hypothetical protein